MTACMVISVAHEAVQARRRDAVADLSKVRLPLNISWRISSSEWTLVQESEPRGRPAARAV